ncbi:DUF6421 family protein [Streptomyces boncukensis]|uniref:Uncharacterized protein n=1 Tax=Streptomyces boncukensis TaxID=2711219 RepID=A0A6G4WWB4_9ACTN|nr:DUF6421 family protein [Streptomyces boncukensis]NGO68761.1 hypothetical protein [Streptomyces boncukensis]
MPLQPLTDALAEVEQLRARLGPRESFRDPAFLRELADSVAGTTHLRRLPIAEAFIEDLRNFPEQPQLTRTKRHINTARDAQIFSLFNASYFPKLSLDLLSYRALPTDETLADRYPSNTMPVNIVERSSGFGSRVVVALFPENHIDGSQMSDDLIFYFINKFVRRHNKLTRRLIEAAMAEGSFPLLRGTTDVDVERASSWWVRLHEYHHRQGDMPIPEFLPAKRYKPLAGLEELRVDISGMLACLNDTELPQADARLAYEYILSERLLRYAVEGIPRPNYDAVASQLLFNYLVEQGGIELRADRIHLLPGLDAALAAFLGEVQDIERHIHTEPVERVRKMLIAFTNRYTDYDESAKDYQHIPFFAELKRRLEV